MQFHEKLRRRVKELDLNKSKAARAVGLPESTISNYLVKEESLPRIDIALKIAKAIDVPLIWLADDSRDWPPPTSNAESSLVNISDRDLMLELAKRFRLGIIDVLDGLDQVEREDWSEIKKKLDAEWREGDPMPPAAQRLAPMLRAIESASNAQLRYNLPYFSMANHKILPGNKRPVPDFDPARWDERFRSLNEMPDFLPVIRRILTALRTEKISSSKAIHFEDGSDWALPPKPPFHPPGFDGEAKSESASNVSAQPAPPDSVSSQSSDASPSRSPEPKKTTRATVAKSRSPKPAIPTKKRMTPSPADSKPQRPIGPHFPN
jgi:DNA-binding XRE family transcriptional regulator